jgi:tetratricopeptide (TPR) repeat protein
MSCSSLKQERVIKNDLSKDALSFYFSAEEMRLRGRYREAINLYDRAGELYISKLAYQDYCLTKLKKALTFITLNKLTTAQSIVKRVTSWQKAFSLELEKEIKGVLAKLYLKQNEKMKAKGIIVELIDFYERELLLKTYYQALLLETGDSGSRELLSKVQNSFNDLYEEYQSKGTSNPDALVFIGKTLLAASNQFTPSLVRKLETLSKELEIPTLSIFVLKHYKVHALEEEKESYEFLIKEIMNKDKRPILI